MNDTAQHPELRTKICSYFKQGCCRAGDNCRFAHDDVSRVQACQYWISGELCPHADYCTFTHPIRIGERYHSSAYPSKLPFQQPTCIIKERMESLKWYWKFLHQDPKPDMLPRTNFRQEDYEHLGREQKSKRKSAQCRKRGGLCLLEGRVLPIGAECPMGPRPCKQHHLQRL
ncbi:hypothetical protein BX666DRAFT_204692 [Dichotomocladium elegans]|nr:hypothetical protein BX666DRAFT_204692 [Dichotomocladium elegans]